MKMLEQTSLLSYAELCNIVSMGVINALPENIKKTTIDVRLGTDIMREETALYNSKNYNIIDLSDESEQAVTKGWIPDKILDSGYILFPGECILGHTVETFNTPLNLSGMFMMRSTIARRFLNSSLSIWINPGFTQSKLVLELHNISQNHSLLLKPNLVIGHVAFWMSTPVPDNIIVERYNNQVSVEAGRPSPTAAPTTA